MYWHYNVLVTEDLETATISFTRFANRDDAFAEIEKRLAEGIPEYCISIQRVRPGSGWL